MARANRPFIQGFTWHIIHRCHKQEFLLNFDKDKKRYIEWLFEAKKRFKLQILNYIVTSNHIHLLVSDNTNNRNSIPDFMQLIAGRTAQEYNQRKKRKGSFWEDRYHATAIQTDKHLLQCMLYIDANMVRAGVVKNPLDWKYSGLNELLEPKKRYSIVDLEHFKKLLYFGNQNDFKESYQKWLAEYLSNCRYESKWSNSIAVGNKDFITNLKEKLSFKAVGRRISKESKLYELREHLEKYSTDSSKSSIQLNNLFTWVS